MHVLFFRQYLPLNQVAALLAGFTSSHLLVEFVPAEHPLLSGVAAEHSLPYEYSTDHFHGALSLQFREIETIAESSDGRVILACKK